MSSDLETLALLILRSLDAPEPEREYRFAAEAVGGPGRGLRQRLRAANLSDWRFDFAWPDWMVALELEGGEWLGRRGRHTGAGYAGDCSKYNAAQLLGWRVFRFTRSMLEAGELERVYKSWLRSAQPTQTGTGGL